MARDGRTSEAVEERVRERTSMRNVLAVRTNPLKPVMARIPVLSYAEHRGHEDRAGAGRQKEGCANAKAADLDDEVGRGDWKQIKSANDEAVHATSIRLNNNG